MSIPPRAQIQKSQDSHEISGETPLSLLYLPPLEETGTLEGELDSTCQQGQLQLTLHITLHNPAGDAVQQQEFPLTNGSFNHPLPPIDSPGYISLSLTSDSPCFPEPNPEKLSTISEIPRVSRTSLRRSFKIASNLGQFRVIQLWGITFASQICQPQNALGNGWWPVGPIT